MRQLHTVHGHFIRKKSKLITLTENAKEYLKKSADPGDYVTLGVKGGGCSGWTYVWDFKKNWPDVNWSDPIDDILVLDPVCEMFVLGCTVDYVNELGGSYLKIINPNSVASCGCGESFAV
jgi:iron-sulfur cluster assembly protein